MGGKYHFFYPFVSIVTVRVCPSGAACFGVRYLANVSQCISKPLTTTTDFRFSASMMMVADGSSNGFPRSCQRPARQHPAVQCWPQRIPVGCGAIQEPEHAAAAAAASQHVQLSVQEEQ